MRSIFIIMLFFVLFSSELFSKELSTEENKKLNEAVSDLNIYLYKKDYRKALEICAEIQKIDKAYGDIKYADIYRVKGDFKESIKWSHEAIKSYKEEGLSIELPLLIMASSYVLMGDSVKSNEVLDKIINLYPDSPMGYKFYAAYYERNNDKQKALYYWREALKRFKDEVAINQAKEKIEELVAN